MLLSMSNRYAERTFTVYKYYLLLIFRVGCCVQSSRNTKLHYYAHNSRLSTITHSRRLQIYIRETACNLILTLIFHFINRKIFNSSTIGLQFSFHALWYFLLFYDWIAIWSDLVQNVALEIKCDWGQFAVQGESERKLENFDPQEIFIWLSVL